MARKTSDRQKDGTFNPNSAYKTNREKRIIEYGGRTNVWYYAIGGGNIGDELAHQHPAAFPEFLAYDHIVSWSNPGDTVLDPFMGSGTTGATALFAERRFIGIELDPGYFAIAEQRIRKASQMANGQFVTKAGSVADTHDLPLFAT